MRELTQQEKDLNSKAIDRHEKNLMMWKLSRDVLQKELELLPLKRQIAEYNQKEELKKADLQVKYYENQIETLQKQNEEGVEENDSTE